MLHLILFKILGKQCTRADQTRHSSSRKLETGTLNIEVYNFAAKKIELYCF